MKTSDSLRMIFCFVFVVLLSVHTKNAIETDSIINAVNTQDPGQDLHVTNITTVLRIIVAELTRFRFNLKRFHNVVNIAEKDTGKSQLRKQNSFKFICSDKYTEICEIVGSCYQTDQVPSKENLFDLFSFITTQHYQCTLGKPRKKFLRILSSLKRI